MMNQPHDPRCCEYCDRPITRDGKGRCRNCGAAIAPFETMVLKSGAIYEFNGDPRRLLALERIHGRAPLFIPPQA
jgi:predicted amidophosphoribosyltransferase